VLMSPNPSVQQTRRLGDVILAWRSRGRSRCGSFTGSAAGHSCTHSSSSVAGSGPRQSLNSTGVGPTVLEEWAHAARPPHLYRPRVLGLGGSCPLLA
jgi:hypothetical protein